MATTNPSSASKVLEVRRHFNASPERVFDAFASAEAIKQWFGPGECFVLSADLDFREGGEYHIRLSTERSGEVGLVGTYQHIERPGQLSFTWRWQDNPEVSPCDSVVDIHFEGQAGGTLMTLRHIGLEEEESRVNHNDGWNGTFDKLERLFT